MMRSVENARVALEDGDADKAIKMMISADQLCARVVAPPTIHGLAMRVISDAYVAKGELADAKKALQKGLDLCKPHDGKAGMPEFMRQDLNGRMGDLLMALGDIPRSTQASSRSRMASVITKSRMGGLASGRGSWWARCSTCK